MLDSFLYMQEDLEQDSVLVQRKKWYSISETGPQCEWDKMAEKMMLEFGEFFFVDTKKKTTPRHVNERQLDT